MAVPYTFGSATTSIPLSQLDSNFATTITLGNTAVQLGNTITSLTGVSNVASATSLSLGSNGNTTAVTIDTSQNVLVGTTTNSASTKVAILGSSTVNGISVRNGTIAGNYESSDATRTSYWQFGRDNVSTGNYVFTYNGSQQACIDTSGNFLLGTTTRSNDEKFTVYQNAAAMGISVRSLGSALGNYETSDQNRVNYWTFGRDNATTGNFVFANNGTQRVAIDTSGKLLVNTTATNSNERVRIKNGDDSRAIAFQSGSAAECGYIYINAGGTGTTYSTSSDYRLKENITPMTGALAKVVALKPVTYKWKVNGSDGQGFIAHELQEIVPDCVTGAKDATLEQEYEVTPAVKDEEGNITTPAVMGTRTVPVYQGIDTSFLVATLTAAMQEQQATINALTARIVALEAK